MHPVLRASMFACLASAPACGLAEPSQTRPSGAPSLTEVQALIGLDRAALLQRLDATPADLHLGEYGPSKNMEAIRTRPPIAGTVFLEDGRVVLVSLYGGLTPSPEPTVFAALRADDLASTHPDAHALPSRSGKQFSHFVAAEAGLAWSAGEGTVTFVEVFVPTDVETYRQRFYQDPGVLYKCPALARG
ncbi:MAG: hypothetical protein Q8P41_02025 [Pseudomonadota bacterium]|nr:hypothetical protein [Pseudomonadota bacterium]